MSLPRHDPRLKESVSAKSRSTGWHKTCSSMAATCRRTLELDNLYVVDTSFPPSIGAVNPALTARSNLVLVGDHVMRRMDARQPDSEPADVG